MDGFGEDIDVEHLFEKTLSWIQGSLFWEHKRHPEKTGSLFLEHRATPGQDIDCNHGISR